MLTFLKSKIHRATVTDANIAYEGSITISSELLAQTDMHEYEKVLVVDVDNGSRLETYIIKTEEPGVVCLNGAAARLVSVGDKVIIMTFQTVDEPIPDYKPLVVVLDKNNRVMH